MHELHAVVCVHVCIIVWELVLLSMCAPEPDMHMIPVMFCVLVLLGLCFVLLWLLAVFKSKEFESLSSNKQAKMDDDPCCVQI